jgi:hypothetical protein
MREVVVPPFRFLRFGSEDLANKAPRMLPASAIYVTSNITGRRVLAEV